MSNLIQRTNNETLSTLVERTNHYARNAKSANTIKAYQKSWAQFESWCAEYNVCSLPATSETVAAYITWLAENGYKASTIQQHISAISQAHQMKEYESPTHSSLFRTTWAGIRRTIGTAQKSKKAAVINDIRLMVDALPSNTLGIRDRALLLIGFAGAFRRSELVSLNVDDIEVKSDGLVITLKHSKTDQEGAGRKVGIPYGSNPHTCPVRAYMAWIEASGITEGAVFRSIDRHGNIKSRMSDKAVALVVKRCAEAAGLDASQYAGHSLRSGFATTAAYADVKERDIMRQTGHKSLQMVRRYIQEGSLFRNNAAANVGL
jgi:site-specific recombinase XerD